MMMNDKAPLALVHSAPVEADERVVDADDPWDGTLCPGCLDVMIAELAAAAASPDLLVAIDPDLARRAHIAITMARGRGTWADGEPDYEGSAGP